MRNHRLLHTELARAFLLTVLCLAGLFGTVGCNKHKILDAEREKLDVERATLIKEMADLDHEIQSMPSAYNTATLERQLETIAKQTAKLEAEADEKMKKWTGLETKLQALKKEVEEYKTRYAQ